MIFQNCYTKFHEPLGEWNLRQFWNITSGIYAKYHIQIMLLFVYTTTLKRFVIFTCRYFKLSWNTTALRQSNCRNFSCSSTNDVNSSEIPNHFIQIYSWFNEECFGHWELCKSLHWVLVPKCSMPNCQWPIAKATFFELAIQELGFLM